MSLPLPIGMPGIRSNNEITHLHISLRTVALLFECGELSPNRAFAETVSTPATLFGLTIVRYWRLRRDTDMPLLTVFVRDGAIHFAM